VLLRNVFSSSRQCSVIYEFEEFAFVIDVVVVFCNSMSVNEDQLMNFVANYRCNI